MAFSSLLINGEGIVFAGVFAALNDSFNNRGFSHVDRYSQDALSAARRRARTRRVRR
ncbi:hypothetical protein BCEP4_1140023 [Burkholderia cepacia]|nr:hypothetical protein BCEP4_1140023 [Burkholderia cepacia]